MRYIGLPLKARPAGEHDSFVLAGDGGPAQILPEYLRSLVEQVDTFRTITEHAQRIRATGWPDDGSGIIEKDLQELVDRGFLVSWETVRSRLTNGEDALGDCFLTQVAIPTRNRPALLARNARSWAEALKRHGRDAGLLVADDSDPDKAALNREALREVSRDGTTVSYAGREERGFAAQRLIAEGLPPRAVRFALFDDEEVGDPYNLNRNFLSLLTAGEGFLSVDDDTLCSYGLPLEPREGLRIHSLADPVDITAFDSRDELMTAVEPAQEDPLAPFERLLGRGMGKILETHAGEVDIATLSGDHVGALLRGGLHVGVCFGGGYGHSGMAHARYVLNLRGPMRRRLSSDRSYLAAAGGSEVINVAAVETLGFVPYGITMNFACDNRRLLPPFFPVKRAMDGLWCGTLRRVSPSSLLAYVPRAILHDPTGRQPAGRDDATRYLGSLSDYLRTAMSVLKPAVPVADTATGLDRWGRHLRDLSRLPWEDFREILRAEWASLYSEYVDYLESLLLYFRREPDAWAEDVDAHIASLREHFTDPDFGLPVDLDRSDREAAGERMKRLTGRFGDLLVEWPGIVEAATQLRRQDVPLTSPP